jgi:hypothetical protein
MDNTWKSVIDADLKDAEYTPREPIADGEYSAIVTNVVAKTFKSGAKGLEVTYSITDEGQYKGREVRDYFVIVKADGDLNKQGAAVTKKLLLEAGLTTKQITSFKFPEYDSKAFGDFKLILDQPLTIEVKGQLQKKGPQAGKTFARVASFKEGAAA